jgi:hypothetical protein
MERTKNQKMKVVERNKFCKQKVPVSLENFNKRGGTLMDKSLLFLGARSLW